MSRPQYGRGLSSMEALQKLFPFVNMVKKTTTGSSVLNRNVIE